MNITNYSDRVLQLEEVRLWFWVESKGTEDLDGYFDDFFEILKADGSLSFEEISDETPVDGAFGEYFLWVEGFPRRHRMGFDDSCPVLIFLFHINSILNIISVILTYISINNILLLN